MANLFDYLSWRSDVPLSADPFNEVDNLVLSYLSYTDFAGCVPEDGAEIAFQDVYEAFFARHTREEIAQDKTLTAKSPLLMDKMVQNARFGNMKMRNYTNVVDPAQDEQFSAVTYLLDDGKAFVAYRGTDNTVVGWKEDFNFSFTTGTGGQQRSIRYLNRIAGEVSRPLLVGGHSKGGNFSIFASSFCEHEVQDRIEIIYANDAPGFSDAVMQAEGYRRILPKILCIIPDTSIIGTLLSSESPQTVIKSSASGLMQHDPLTWEVERNRFVKAELSELGLFFSQTISSWLSGLDNGDKKAFTDTIFSLFEATGQDTFVGISEDGWKSLEAILSSLGTMSRERQKLMNRLIGKLLESSGKVAGEQFRNLPVIKSLEEQLSFLYKGG